MFLDKATATVYASGSTQTGGLYGATPIFQLEVIGNGTSFNSTASVDSNGRLAPRADDAASNAHFNTGSFGGRGGGFGGPGGEDS